MKHKHCELSEAKHMKTEKIGMRKPLKKTTTKTNKVKSIIINVKYHIFVYHIQIGEWAVTTKLFWVHFFFHGYSGFAD